MRRATAVSAITFYNPSSWCWRPLVDVVNVRTYPHGSAPRTGALGMNARPGRCKVPQRPPRSSAEHTHRPGAAEPTYTNRGTNTTNLSVGVEHGGGGSGGTGAGRRHATARQGNDRARGAEGEGRVLLQLDYHPAPCSLLPSPCTTSLKTLYKIQDLEKGQYIRWTSSWQESKDILFRPALKIIIFFGRLILKSYQCLWRWHNLTTIKLKVVFHN